MILVSVILFYQFKTSYKNKGYEHLKEIVQTGKKSTENFLKDKTIDIRLLTEIYGIGHLHERSHLEEILNILKTQKGPAFLDLALINEDGEQVAHAGQRMFSKSIYSDAVWYRQAMKTGKGVSHEFANSQGLYSIIIAVKKIHDGKSWILRAAIDVKFIHDHLVNSVPMREDGFAFILDHEGKHFTTPPHFIKPRKGTIIDFLGIGAMGKNGIAVVQRKNAYGHNNVYATTLLEESDSWLVYRQKASEVFSGLKKVQTVTMVVILIVGLLIAVEAISLSKKMVRRIALADKEKQKLNERMFQTGKLASIGELAAGVAHEINNPVAIMIEEAGWIDDLLEDEEFKETKNMAEFRRALKQIQTQGKRCKEITHKLLSFARKTDTSVQKVDVNGLIDDIIAISEKKAEHQGIAIHKSIQKDFPPIEISQTEFQQVLFNLINNGLDAMEEKGDTLFISAQLAEDHLVIEVADNGSGIPEEVHSRIFDPFFTTKPFGKGTGLGLSICYGIINKMGGEISVKSEINGGSTFRVMIPLQEKTGNLAENSPEIPDSQQRTANL
jgi:two-component system NtrC family sensor kinase